SSVSALIEKLQAKIRGLSNGPALTSALPSSLDSGGLDPSQLTQMLQALQALALPGGNGSRGLETSQFTQVLQALQALQCGDNADCLQTASCNEVGQLMGLCPNAGMDGKQ
ncbi:MAG: hypothetical protein PHU14_10395, partial [Methylovulum sp.]|nr:hypothetical protein [Methylovulum sp.]